MSKRAEQRRLRRQQEGAEMGGASGISFRTVLIVALGGAALIVVWNVFFSTTGQGARAPVDLGPLSSQQLVELAAGEERGDPDAPLAILDFSDYQCPACADFTARGKPFLEERYVEAGLLLFVYHDFPLPGHRHAFLAARAARCAGDQGAYWRYHDELFRRQREWSGQADPFSTFTRIAADLGLDRSDFRSCLGSDRHADVVTANYRLGRELGVDGTPTLFLRTGEGRAERVEDWSPQAIGPRLDAALERLGHAPPGGNGGEPGEPGAER